jgi:two-component system, LuxR family, response regulator FixJ
MTNDETVFVVDDDEAVRDSVGTLLEISGFHVEAHPSAKTFLASGSLEKNGCVIADIRMPDMDGLELQIEMKRRGSKLPMIIMTGHGDVPLAVRAMKAGAIDFLEKPYDTKTLLESVRLALEVNRGRQGASVPSNAAQELVAKLTPREKEVLDLVVAGKMNKVIAYELSISHRTVEIHRGRLMQKLGARNLAELIRMFPSG